MARHARITSLITMLHYTTKYHEQFEDYILKLKYIYKKTIKSFKFS
jgi:hypothetical protein